MSGNVNFNYGAVGVNISPEAQKVIAGANPSEVYAGINKDGGAITASGSTSTRDAVIPELEIGQRAEGNGPTVSVGYSDEVYNKDGVKTGSTTFDGTQTEIWEYEKAGAEDVWFQQGEKTHNTDVTQTSTTTKKKDPVMFDLNKDGKYDITDEDNSTQTVNETTDVQSESSTSGNKITTTTTTTKESDTLTNWNNKIDYDIDGDGNVDRTQWAKDGCEDGFLVMDINDDGKITGNELMNESTTDGKTQQFADGWEKTRYYGDANGDGKISGDELSKFKVWVDSNGDGVTDSGELKSMTELGVVEIDTNEGSYTTGKKVGMESSYHYHSEQNMTPGATANNNQAATTAAVASAAAEAAKPVVEQTGDGNTAANIQINGNNNNVTIINGATNSSNATASAGSSSTSSCSSSSGMSYNEQMMMMMMINMLMAMMMMRSMSSYCNPYMMGGYGMSGYGMSSYGYGGYGCGYGYGGYMC